MIKILNLLPGYKWIFSSIWLSIILFLSLAKFPSSNELGLFSFTDKIVHFSMYFILSTLLLFELKNSTKKSIIYAIMLYTIFIGALMELLQLYVFTYRSGDYRDIIFNSIGSFAALIFYKLINTFIKQ